MIFFARVMFLFLSLILGACVQAPTVVTDSDASLLQRAYDFESKSRPLKVTPETVVLDVRGFFDYQLLHIPGAISVDARDFNLRKLQGDDLQVKAVQLSRRLALMGINPFTHVVVIGDGGKGKGEEGLVALTLMSLGVERVQLGSVEQLKPLMRPKDSERKANQRYWEPRLVEALSCPMLTDKRSAFIISVGKESLSSVQQTHGYASFQKDWKSFVNLKDFSPNFSIKEDLRKDEIRRDSRLMVRGPQAPIAVFSLIQLGYNQVCLLEDD